MTTYTNRVDDGIVKALPEVRVEVRGIEHSAFGQTFVNWKGVSTINITKRRKCKIDLDILLRTFLFDRILQIKLM